MWMGKWMHALVCDVHIHILCQHQYDDHKHVTYICIFICRRCTTQKWGYISNGVSDHPLDILLDQVWGRPSLAQKTKAHFWIIATLIVIKYLWITLPWLVSRIAVILVMIATTQQHQQVITCLHLQKCQESTIIVVTMASQKPLFRTAHTFQITNCQRLVSSLFVVCSKEKISMGINVIDGLSFPFQESEVLEMIWEIFQWLWRFQRSQLHFLIVMIVIT